MLSRINEVVSTIYENIPVFQHLKIRSLFIGGSVGRGEGNQQSDLDLFAVVDNRNIKRFHDRYLFEFASRFGHILIYRGPIWVEYFGYSNTFVYSDGFILQVNVNTPQLLEPSCFANFGARIVFDEGSVLAGFFKAASVLEFCHEKEFQKWFDYALIRLLLCVREVRKGGTASALSYFSQVRESVYAILSCRQRRKWKVPQSPSKGFEKEAQAMIRNAPVVNAINNATAMNILEVCTAVTDWLRKESEDVAFRSAEDRARDWRVVVDLISEEIGTAEQEGWGASGKEFPQFRRDSSGNETL